MRIAFLLEPPRHGRGIAGVTAETVDRLRARDVQVDLLLAEHASAIIDLSNFRPEHDLYVLKSKSALTHSLAGAIEATGGCVVNSFASAVLTWDKIATTGVLAAVGIPVPDSWTAGQPSVLGPLIEEGSLWLKPQHGKSGSGVRRVDDLATLDDEPKPAADTCGYPVPVFAQRDVRSDGFDFKVYVIGDRLWSMVKRWPPRGTQDKIGTPVPLPDSIRSAALAVGRVLGLELYGVDFLFPRDGSGEFAVVDVNAFPGYNGLSEAPAALAAYLFERALRPERLRAVA